MLWVSDFSNLESTNFKIFFIVIPFPNSHPSGVGQIMKFCLLNVLRWAYFKHILRLELWKQAYLSLRLKNTMLVKKHVAQIVLLIYSGQGVEDIHHSLRTSVKYNGIADINLMDYGQLKKQKLDVYLLSQTSKEFALFEFMCIKQLHQVISWTRNIY